MERGEPDNDAPAADRPGLVPSPRLRPVEIPGVSLTDVFVCSTRCFGLVSFDLLNMDPL